MEEQRHPGKPDAKYHWSTRQIDPLPFEMEKKEDVPIETHEDAPPPAVEEEVFATGIPLICLVAGLMFAVFLISIDRTIISTVRKHPLMVTIAATNRSRKAIPYITSEFKSTPDIGWYGSAYLLTACAFQPVFGRVFTLFSIKKSYLVAMFLFEFGSLLCGVARNSMTLIVGRAIAGFGSAGILTGSFVVVSTAVPLQVRPIFMAVVGLM